MEKFINAAAEFGDGAFAQPANLASAPKANEIFASPNSWADWKTVTADTKEADNNGLIDKLAKAGNVASSSLLAPAKNNVDEATNAAEASSETAYIDKQIKDLENELAELEKSLNSYHSTRDFLKNQANGGGDFFAWLGSRIGGTGKAIEASIKDFEANHARANERYAMLKAELSQLKAKRTELLTNIDSNDKKYTREARALAKVGVTNPFFMLKNGLISSGISVGLNGQSMNSGSVDNKDEKENPLSKIMEFIKLLLLVKAAK